MKNIGIAIVIALGIIISAWILGNAVKNRNSSLDTISVTGSGYKNFTSDLIVWQGNFSRKSKELRTAYSELDNDRNIIRNYLLSNGVYDSSLIFSAVNLSKDYEYIYQEDGRSRRVFKGYFLTQNVKIESQSVDKIEKISRDVSQLINKGVIFKSELPEYYYTELQSLKHEMIVKATKDAQQRAQEIAENAGSSLGSLKNADLGVFQITGRYSTEEYTWSGAYNKLDKEKTASVTVRLEYKVE